MEQVERLTSQEIIEGYSFQQKLIMRIYVALQATQWLSYPSFFSFLPSFIPELLKLLVTIFFLFFHKLARQIVNHKIKIFHFFDQVSFNYCKKVEEKRKKITIEEMRLSWEIAERSPILRAITSILSPKLAVQERKCLDDPFFLLPFYKLKNHRFCNFCSHSQWR